MSENVPTLSIKIHKCINLVQFTPAIYFVQLAYETQIFINLPPMCSDTSYHQFELHLSLKHTLVCINRQTYFCRLGVQVLEGEFLYASCKAYPNVYAPKKGNLIVQPDPLLPLLCAHFGFPFQFN